MTDWQQLTRVELPLALPVIVAGVRTAAVWIVGIATLSTPVGATSLGNFIFSGLQTRNSAAVWLGCVAAAVLALVLDGLVHAIESGIRHGRRRLLASSVAGLTILCAGVTAPLLSKVAFERARPIVVGAKTFTEQYILSEILAIWIEERTGRATTLVQSLGSMVAFDALDAGDIDLYVDYSGTLWANAMRRTEIPPSRSEVLRQVERFLLDRHQMTLVSRLGFENAYALAVRRLDAERLGLARISDLPPHAPALVMGGDYEFFARPEWASIRDTYGLRFADLRTMDSTLMYQAAAEGNVDVISAFSSDGRIRAYDLTVLEDDRQAIPPYDAVVLASQRLAREEPAVTEAVSRLTGRITVDAMRAMNLAVDERGEAPAVVARRFVDDLVR